MPITAFPAASVLVSGQSIIGKSTSGAGICAELSPSDVRTLIGAQSSDATLTALAAVTTAADKLVYATGADTFATTDLTAFARTILDDADAATVLSTIGAQAALVSGTNIKTINNQSLLGSGNITISGGSGSPGGATTQIQFNSSSAFAGSENLTWDGTAINLITPELAPDEGSGYVMRIRPPGDRNNKPFNIISGVSQNPNGSFNFGVNMGFNAAPGGGAEDPDVSGFWLAFEENWQTVVGGVPSRLKEFHICFSPPATGGLWVKNQHIRLTSFEVNETTRGIIEFHSVNGFDLRIPKSTSDGPIYFVAAPGQLLVRDSTATHVFSIETTGGYITFTGSHLLLFQTAMQCQSTFTALGNIFSQSAIGASGTVTSQSTSGNAIAADAGGIFARKAIASGTAMWIYAHAVQGSPTTEPAAVGDATVLFTRINSGSYELWAKFPNATVKKLADDT